jgi:glycosyltransferase involved in cell wall biosynthesis
MDVSIIIVTRNRAADLAETLHAIAALERPEGLEIELLVVDNGSADETAELVRSFRTTPVPPRYSHEPRTGKTIGQNRALRETTGRVLLFTDDDVRPPADWISGMCGPVLRGEANAVCGGVRLAPHLLHDWMTPMHRSWLASTEWLGEDEPQSMVGANMAFSRDVLSRVPGFDPELGPGALGFGDDHLFAMQLLEAGFRIHDRRDLQVEHHCDPSRLTRDSWLAAAGKFGASQAYIGHHWEHWGCRMAAFKLLRTKLELAAWRLTNRSPKNSAECSEKELQRVFNLALVRKHISVSNCPRNYDRHGLIKQHGVPIT